MNKKNFNLIMLVTFFGLLFVSCGQDSLTSARRSSKQTQMVGINGQSCLCSYQNDPVCGENGITYNNPCIAQCDGVNYKSGSCSSSNPSSCNQSSGLICGQPPYNCPTGVNCTAVMPQPQTYSNECDMLQNNARFISMGACQSGTLEIVQ